MLLYLLKASYKNKMINNKDKRFIFEDAYFDGKKFIYFFAYDVNGLFKMDITNGKTDFVGSIKEYPINQKRMYGAVAAVKNKLIFAPISADDILIFDVESVEYKLIPLQTNPIYKYRDAKFNTACAVDNKVYLFPIYYPAIIEVDPQKEIIQYYSEWVDEYKEHLKQGLDFFRHTACFFEKHILIPFCYKNNILDFDTHTKKYRIFEVDELERNCGFSGICFDGSFYWLPQLTGDKICRWKYETNEFMQFEIGNNSAKGLFSYVDCLALNDSVMVVPALGNNLLKIDVHKLQINEISLEKIGIVEEVNENFLSSMILLNKIRENQYIICCPHKKHNLYLMINRINDMVFEPYPIDYSKALEDLNCKSECKFISLSQEDSLCDLKMFIERLC